MKKIKSLQISGKLIGFIILTFFAIMAILAPLISPYDPFISFKPMLHPNFEHLLGTNDLGQDIMSELIYGSRVSLIVGFSAAIISLFIGLILGVIAGYFRGWIDEIVMGITDIFFTLPALPLAILLAAYLGPSIWNIVAILGIVTWPSTARVVRSQVLTIRELGFIESSRALGASPIWNINHHIIPHVTSIIIAKFALAVSAAMIAEASLSFLGLGDPTTKSWGAMIHYAFTRGGFIQNLWWWYIPPGLCIGLCVLGFSLLSFSMAEESDPRIKRMLEK